MSALDFFLQCFHYIGCFFSDLLFIIIDTPALLIVISTLFSLSTLYLIVRLIKGVL